MKRMVVGRMGMISAVGEQQSITAFEKFDAPHGTWWVGLKAVYKMPDGSSFEKLIPNRAEYIYYRAKDGKHSEGFAGRTMHFPLTDGTVDAVQGPWHGNPNSMYEGGGPDFRGTTFTRVTIAERRGRWDEKVDGPGWGTVLENILYHEEDWVLGEYMRGDAIALQMANELERPLVLNIESRGGGYCGTVNPTPD